MKELDSLNAREQELFEELFHIATEFEGINDKENSEKIGALNSNMAILLEKKESLENSLKSVNKELKSAESESRKISWKGIKKILKAINNQRWYFFKNTPKVIMDRDNAVMWIDPGYFPCVKKSGEEYSLSEIHQIADKSNGEKLAGFSDWRVPTLRELATLSRDNGFPGYLIMKEHELWAAELEGEPVFADIKDLTARGETGCVIVCRDTPAPFDYAKNIKNNFYAKSEKLQMTLDVFLENGLIPSFDTEEIDEIFSGIYIRKPKILCELAKVTNTICKLENASQNIAPKSPDFTENYGDDPDSSVIKYAGAIMNLTDSALLKLYGYKKENAEEQISSAKDQIVSIHNSAEKILKKVSEINAGENIFSDLAALEAVPRAKFSLVAEDVNYILKSARDLKPAPISDVITEKNENTEEKP